jgi:hypothetical protein
VTSVSPTAELPSNTILRTGGLLLTPSMPVSSSAFPPGRRRGVADPSLALLLCY